MPVPSRGRQSPLAVLRLRFPADHLHGAGPALVRELAAAEWSTSTPLPMIDDEWTERHDDGFTRWAHGLAQRYHWEGPAPVDDIPTWFLSVETDFLRGGTDPTCALAFRNRANDTLELGAGAVVLDGDRIRLRTRTYAMPESAEQHPLPQPPAPGRPRTTALLGARCRAEWLGAVLLATRRGRPETASAISPAA
jgi:hypothetical protein